MLIILCLLLVVGAVSRNRWKTVLVDYVPLAGCHPQGLAGGHSDAHGGNWPAPVVPRGVPSGVRLAVWLDVRAGIHCRVGDPEVRPAVSWAVCRNMDSPLREDFHQGVAVPLGVCLGIVLGAPSALDVLGVVLSLGLGGLVACLGPCV